MSTLFRLADPQLKASNVGNNSLATSIEAPRLDGRFHRGLGRRTHIARATLRDVAAVLARGRLTFGARWTAFTIIATTDGRPSRVLADSLSASVGECRAKVFKSR